MFRLTDRDTMKSTTKLQDLAYTYDAVGNISQIVDASNTNTAKTAEFEYDWLDRLTSAEVTNSAAGGNYTRTYQYNAIGNMTYNSILGSYTYAGLETATANGTYAHPHAVTTVNSETYTYDHNGNLTDDGTWEHTWNYKNQLVSSTDGDTTLNYAYDEAGNRIKKESETTGETSYYVNSLFDTEGLTNKKYFYAGSTKLATETDEVYPLCSEANWSYELEPAYCPISGEQTKVWTQTDTQCVDGVTHPASEVISCTPEVFDSCNAVIAMDPDADNGWYLVQPDPEEDEFEAYCDFTTTGNPWTHQVKKLALGADHMCALLVDGTVECAGLNSNGQLGDGTTTQRTSPTAISGLDHVVDLAAGSYHTCAVIDDGSVSCWGYNVHGELGRGTTSSYETSPYAVSNISTATHVDAGRYHTCVALSDGTAECFGDNGYGQLGDDSSTDSSVPVEVSGLEDVATVSVNNYFSCALLTDGTLKCWGDNYFGQLGDNTTTRRYTPVSVQNISTATDLGTGSNHACAVLSDNTAKCWGRNDGRLGDGNTANSSTPVSVSVVTTVEDIDVGFEYTCAIADDDTYCWGNNSYGQLGLGYADSTMVLDPTDLGIDNPEHIFAGAKHTCTQLEDQSVMCYGNNANGKMGTGDTTNHYDPYQILNWSDHNATEACGEDDWEYEETVSCDGSDYRTLAWTKTNQSCVGGITHESTEQELCPLITYVSCGDVLTHFPLEDPEDLNDFYYLKPEPTDTPYQAYCDMTTEGGPFAQLVKQAAGGYRHSCTLLETGEVKCSGYNYYGQVGDGTNTTRLSPVTVSGISTATKITSNNYFSCALLGDGTVQCWGDNEKGQLGDGTTTDSNTPVEVDNLSDVIDISAGRKHTCAVIDDGTMKCWGYNGYGQLGNDSQTDSLSPVTVSGISTAVAVESGNHFTCALLEDETMKCWGDNYYGQLGDNSTTRRLTPVSVQNLTDIVSFASAYNHTCAVKDTGYAYCWGRNDGRLGDGNTATQSLPTQVITISGIETIDATFDHTCALDDDGTLYCWGLNDYGQIGDGNVGAAVGSPVQIIASGVSSVTAGRKHTCSIMEEDKSVMCWGDGADGLLGTGDTTDHLTPYEITTLREVSDAEPYFEVDSHLTYHHSDHLGSTSIDTDEDGAVLQLVDYYPYGGTRLDEQAGTDDNPYMYNGKELDEDTGLYYYGARYYNAEVARFTSQDPWGGDVKDPQSLNKYAYVQNNPLKYVDPTGEKLVISADDDNPDFIDYAFDELKKLSPYVGKKTLDNGDVEIFMHDAPSKSGKWLVYFLSGCKDCSVGTDLLTRIIDDDNTVTIEAGSGYHTYANSEDAVNGVGSDATIEFLFGADPSAFTYDSKTGTVQNEIFPDYIVLGHELIHSLHMIKGTFIETDSTVPYTGLNGTQFSHPEEEVRTVGLGFNQAGDITEHQLEEEHGRNKRNHY
jgi:RHS repeat-associated protein